VQQISISFTRGSKVDGEHSFMGMLSSTCITCFILAIWPYVVKNLVTLVYDSYLFSLAMVFIWTFVIYLVCIL
jgi:hypothetical protein